MKKLTLMTLLATCIFAAEPATKNDINMMMKMIDANNQALNQRIDTLDKRIDALDKRIDTLEESINKRIDTLEESTNKQLEAINKRIDTLQESTNKQLEAINKRIDTLQESTNRQLEMINKRIDTVNDYMLALMSAIVAMIGFMVWDRRTMMEKTKKEMEIEFEKILEERLAKKADKALLDKILEIIERLAKDDKETQELLKKHRMSFA